MVSNAVKRMSAQNKTYAMLQRWRCAPWQTVITSIIVDRDVLSAVVLGETHYYSTNSDIKRFVAYLYPAIICKHAVRSLFTLL
jgi:hypothetical protein